MPCCLAQQRWRRRGGNIGNNRTAHFYLSEEQFTMAESCTKVNATLASSSHLYRPDRLERRTRDAIETLRQSGSTKPWRSKARQKACSVPLAWQAFSALQHATAFELSLVLLLLLLLLLLIKVFQYPPQSPALPLKQCNRLHMSLICNGFSALPGG